MCSLNNFSIYFCYFVSEHYMKQKKKWAARTNKKSNQCKMYVHEKLTRALPSTSKNVWRVWGVYWSLVIASQSSFPNKIDWNVTNEWRKNNQFLIAFALSKSIYAENLPAHNICWTFNLKIVAGVIVTSIIKLKNTPHHSNHSKCMTLKQRKLIHIIPNTCQMNWIVYKVSFAGCWLWQTKLVCMWTE